MENVRDNDSYNRDPASTTQFASSLMAGIGAAIGSVLSVVGDQEPQEDRHGDFFSLPTPKKRRGGN